MAKATEELSHPRVSVVMRTKNSEWVISEALAALFSQTYDNFELFVVDSGSTDRTLELLRSYPHRLVEIPPEDYHPGRVLNMAVEQCRGEIIVFQNSDGVPLTTETLGRLIAAFDDPETSAALTRQIPRPDAHSWVRREYKESFPDAEKTPDWITLSLPMAAIRRSAWEQHPFYTQCWGSEDTEWGHWAKREGLRIQYVSEATIMHSHNYSLHQLYGRMFIEGEADAFIYGKHETLVSAAARTVVRSFRDFGACLKQGDLEDVARVIPRRLVHHLAYYRGNRLGRRRRESGDIDPSRAQKIVLRSHHGRSATKKA